MSDIVQKLWGFCHTLRHDGIDYGDYIEQITYLLFLKMADERALTLPKGCGWQTLREKSGTDLTDTYVDLLRTLGKETGLIGDIYAGAQSRFSNPVNLKRLVTLIDETEWTALGVNVKAEAYEGLLEKAASEGKKGAGQYFTPRPPIKAVVRVMKPDPRGKREFSICDPACGTGEFLVAAYEWLMKQTKDGALALDRDTAKRVKKDVYFGQDLVARPRRLSLMNLVLHGLHLRGASAQQLLDDPIAFAQAAGTVASNSLIVATNTFTFGLITPLNQASDILIQQNGFYKVIQVGAIIGREIAIQAALAAVTGGAGNVLAGVALAGGRLGATAATTIRTLQTISCFATSVQRLAAPVQTALQMYSLGSTTYQAYQAAQRGDYWDAAADFMQAGFQLPGLLNGFRQTARLFSAASQGTQALGAYLAACFAAGTPIRWEYGCKNIEEFTAGERVWARNENDPDGPLGLREIEECFASTGAILHVHVGGRVIRTTPEHPFWVDGHGWVEAAQLQPGDLLASHDGQWTPVDEILDIGEFETVYNFRVGEDHTYFVGGADWQFSVWSHNVCRLTTGEHARRLRANLGSNIRANQQAHHIVASTHPRAREARSILRGFGLGIDSRLNGVGLRHNLHHGRGLHSYEGIDRVTDMLRGATSRAEAIEILNEIRRLQRLGRFLP